jgi:hypothetical protein
MKKYGHAFVIQHPNFMVELDDGSVVCELSRKISRKLSEERGNGSIIVHNYSEDFLGDDFQRETDICENYRLIKLDKNGSYLPQWRLNRSENMDYFIRHPCFKKVDICREYFEAIYKDAPKSLKPKVSSKEIVLVENWRDTGFRAAAAAIRALLKKDAKADICGLYSNDQGSGCVDRMAIELSRQGITTVELEGMKYDYLLYQVYPAIVKA